MNIKIIKIIKNNISFLATCLIYYIVLFVILGAGKVPTGSMVPTFPIGERIIYTKNIKNLKRKDIIIFKKDGVLLTKRIIGLPNEHLSIKDNNVYINEKKLNESYILNPNSTISMNFVDIDIKENEYIVLGDNRENSFDSRYWENPFLNSNQIVGKVIFHVNPIIFFVINAIAFYLLFILIDLIYKKIGLRIKF